MGSPVKVIKLDELNEKIEELEVVRNKIAEVLQMQCTSLEDVILKKYIELQNGAKVTEFLNNEGYRIKSNGKLGERKYSSNDVTDIIINSNSSSHVSQVAKILYKFNTGKVAWVSVHKLCNGL